MRLSMELFLLDNLLMDYLILKVAAVLNGKRLRVLETLLACTLGSAYALLSLTAWTFLQHPILKILLGLMMALPIKRSWNRYIQAVVYLYIAAFFSGGLMFALSMLLGGSVRAGAIVGTVPLRVFLIAAAILAAAPRAARLFISTVQARTKRVRMLMSFPDRTLELTALLDSGNLLTEPISGLPVVVVKKGLLPRGTRPVPYRTIDGEGFLYAVRPVTLQVFQGSWMEIDAYAADAPGDIDGADAIIDAALLTWGGFQHDIHALKDDSDCLVSAHSDAEREADPLHPLGGDAAAAVSAGGGAGVDTEADGR